MQNAIFISEILGTIADGRIEVCASAETDYDSTQEKVSVSLDAFVRSVSTAGDGQHESRSWLPTPERVTEHLPREEAGAFTKDVFHSWIRKVRAAIPGELHLQT